MSMSGLTNNICAQPQNIVLNQVHQVQPIAHTVMSTMSNANNGLPMSAGSVTTNQVSAHQHAQIGEHQPGGGDMKATSVLMDTSPMPGMGLVSVQTPVHSAQTVPSIAMQPNNSPIKSMHLSNSTNTSTTSIPSSSEAVQVLSKTRMADLIRDIDPNMYMEDDVEEYLLGYVDDFVDRVINGASLIAKHRHVKNIEVKDVQMFINRNYNMWAPGLGTDELRPYKRSLTTESHKQRLALIRKALKKY